MLKKLCNSEAVNGLKSYFLASFVAHLYVIVLSKKKRCQTNSLLCVAFGGADLLCCM